MENNEKVVKQNLFYNLIKTIFTFELPNCYKRLQRNSESIVSGMKKCRLDEEPRLFCEEV